MNTQIMNIPLLYFLFSSLTYEIVTQENIKIFRKKTKFIFAIGFQTVYCWTCFYHWLIQTVFCGSNFRDLAPKSQKEVS